MISPLSIFVSYAHTDEEFRAELEKRLILLKVQGRIQTWNDRHLVPGDTWNDEIAANLDKAQLILLLVSIDFLSSDFIQKNEVPRALQRHAAKQATVVPIIVRSVVWSAVTGLNFLQALPIQRGAKDEVLPVQNWPTKDEAWTAVESGLRRTIDSLSQNGNAPSGAPVATSKCRPPRAYAEGLRALQTLLSMPTSTRITPEVRAGLDQAKAAAERRIEQLGNYKDLHDQLHDLQFQCYNFILQESRRKDENDIDWEAMHDVDPAFGEIVTQLQRIRARPLLAPAETEWVKDLVAARVHFESALSQRAMQPLKLAVRGISGVISVRPSEINNRLRDVARTLPLQELHDAMSSLKGQLQPAELETLQGKEFLAGLDALSELREIVSQLTEEHDQWQATDAEMRRINAQLRRDTSDLEFAWPGNRGLRAKLIKRCDSCPGADWSEALRGEIGKMDIVLATGNPEKITQVFRRTYSLAGARFFDVDLELKNLCDELRSV